MTNMRSPRNVCEYDRAFFLPPQNTTWSNNDQFRLDTVGATEQATGVWEVILNLSSNDMRISTYMWVGKVKKHQQISHQYNDTTW